MLSFRQRAPSAATVIVVGILNKPEDSERKKKKKQMRQMRFVRRIKRKKEEKIHCASRSRSDTETVKRVVRRIPFDLQRSSSLASLEVF